MHSEPLNKPRKIYISQQPIRLGQFLKYADVVQDGIEAKLRIVNGEISVNSVVETQRGKKLVHGDEVTIDDLRLQVVVKNR